jgi:hypothetical protein
MGGTLLVPLFFVQASIAASKGYKRVASLKAVSATRLPSASHKAASSFDNSRGLPPLPETWLAP